MRARHGTAVGRDDAGQEIHLWRADETSDEQIIRIVVDRQWRAGLCDFAVTVNGTTYSDGYDCNGQPATVSLYVWPADDPNAQPQIVPVKDIGNFKFFQDRLALTIAVVPQGTEVPRPPSVPELDKLTDVAGATTTTTTTGSGATGATGSTDTTAPTTSTTAAGTK